MIKVKKIQKEREEEKKVNFCKVMFYKFLKILMDIWIYTEISR